MCESLLRKIADLEKALENPLAEPRLNLSEYKGGYSVDAARRVLSLGYTLRQIYDAIDRCTLKNIENQTPEICRKAIEENEFELLFVKEKTPDICLAAIRKNPYFIRYLNGEYHTQNICMEAVKKTGTLLEYITPENQTDEICLTAIENSYGWAIGYIANQKPEFCMKALDINPQTFCCIRKKFRTNEIVDYAIAKRIFNVYYIDNPSEELQLKAVEQDGMGISYIHAPKSPAVCLAAVKQNPQALKRIKPKHQTPEICLAAVKQNGMLLHLVKEQTPDICKAAVAQNPKSERMVRDKTMLSD